MSRSLFVSLCRATPSSSSRAFSSSSPRAIPNLYSTLTSQKSIESKLKEIGIVPISITRRRQDGFNVEVAKSDVDTCVRSQVGTPLASYTTTIYDLDLETYPGLKFNDFLRQVYSQTGSGAANIKKEAPNTAGSRQAMSVRWAREGDVEKLLKAKILGAKIEIATDDLPLSLDELDKDLNWMKPYLNV